MLMPTDNLEVFINFCDSLANIHIHWISDPAAHKRISLSTTILDFMSDCKTFFQLETYKLRANQPAFILLKNLYEKIDAFILNDERSYKLFETFELPNDPHWNEIQKLAKKTQDALNLFLKEVHTNKE